MNRYATAQVGQAKGFRTVAAIGGADRREQEVIVTNAFGTAVAQKPVDRRAAEGEHANFSNHGARHGRWSCLKIGWDETESGTRRENAVDRDAKTEYLERLHVVVTCTAAAAVDGVCGELHFR